jgi:hypothetical protein
MGIWSAHQFGKRISFRWQRTQMKKLEYARSEAGSEQMSRRNFEITGHMNERDSKACAGHP